MKDSIESFKREIGDLRHYIRGIELESQLLSFRSHKTALSEESSLIRAIQEHHSEFATKRRQFNYNTIIVSLYGFLEQFVESLISAYIRYLNMIIPEYENLPEAIRKNHVTLSLDLLKLSEQSKYREKFSTEEIISNLHSCINQTGGYRINEIAFIQHTANFRADVIQEFFAKVGVEGVSGRIKYSSVFINYLKSKHPNREIEDIKRDSEYLFYLNDLAERRNEVAHGTLADELLSNDILSEYINFSECYGEALYEVVYSEALPYMIQYLPQEEVIELGKPIKIFQNGKIIGIFLKNISVSKGDLIIAGTNNKKLPYLAGEITEIQINNVSYEKISVDTEGKEVGIRIPFRAKEKHNIYIIFNQHRKTVNNRKV